MTRPPTAAQRRIIDAAEPVTGRLTGTEAQLAALVKRGLAFRHPRPPHDHFLTPAGHRIREAAARAAGADQVSGSAPASGAAAGASASATAAASAAPSGSGASGVFAARVGGEEGAVSGPARAREVHSAWQGLLELRRMTNPDGAMDRPCGWERTHLVQAAALALEAAGHRPAGAAHGSQADPTNADGGYRVRATAQPEAVAVHEPDPEALRACAATLEKAGWQVSEHTDPRTRERYLLASPRRT
ncbi:hypothetical protein Sipo8835_04455 [Streptomyces ipomoeae]|uniref:Uncharacterized protein n=1 Tax=Streptomyces ipomoeae TaxID=103232 RepID=A0AAE8W680_9ACTN|nr:hypothetical protein [Streptomyces ipomoeae]MDX2694363.1 hypothetical protein [Streptomyces ipomoeae]MDX2821373.1 hypothetical protein [Streptomyces ipomoeae]MDX2840960.1 hypothetical protein [Streptomyces ipomoeae]MDX2875366.1 hypothetical protein [Streptomyces ipomoeae]TQE38587.1 hypothetical protein Sipo8835_04455 [Streptomyces ipomoeae]